MMHERAETYKFLVVDMYYHHLSISLLVNDYSGLNMIRLTLSYSVYASLLHKLSRTSTH